MTLAALDLRTRCLDRIRPGREPTLSSSRRATSPTRTGPASRAMPPRSSPRSGWT